jgi:hypothetical protein
MLADQVPGSPANRQDQASLAIDELAMMALAVPSGRPRPAQPDTEALAERLEQLAAALQTGRPPQAARRTIQLPGYPRIRAATELLASAIG